ncbi:hypothetical protein ACM46_13025 [Chryseobacterium angstadtii]|uniref:Uncharacterized protein n=1 Tax=Chryseobacterium angstadtii TaxID=558151 RepID=A0A0J7IGJ3_9FLAO|nr:hypothetical protein [Chryseobacterium angstadtii]KMQ65106.1 hypothetical protein ACM46_13025 [Chryseobacterium angstadtii]
MKSIILVMIIGFTVLSCKKEAKTELSTNSDSIVIDTLPADTLTAAIPSDTLEIKDTAPTKKADSTTTIKK